MTRVVKQFVVRISQSFPRNSCSETIFASKYLKSTIATETQVPIKSYKLQQRVDACLDRARSIFPRRTKGELVDYLISRSTDSQSPRQPRALHKMNVAATRCTFEQADNIARMETTPFYVRISRTSDQSASISLPRFTTPL